MPEIEEITGPEPGPGNDSGRSEQDVEVSTDEMRRRLGTLAGDVTQAAGQGLRQEPPLQQSAQPAPQTLAAPQPQAQSAPQPQPQPQAPAQPPRTAQPPQTAQPAPQAQAPTHAEPDEDEMIGAPSDGDADNTPTIKSTGETPDQVRMRMEDAADARESEQIAGQRRRAQIGALIAGLLSDRVTPDVARGMVAPYDPQAPMARRAEQRADDYRQALEERRMELENRRIAQAESATESRNRRTSAEYDVDSQDATGLRDLYDAAINGLPEEAQRILGPGFTDLDTSGYNASTMQAALERLDAQIDLAQRQNPRAFRQGQRSSGGARRRGGRLALDLGGGGTRNYGYGVQRREGGQAMAGGISAEDEAARSEGRHTPDDIRRMRSQSEQDPETGLPAPQSAPAPRAGSSRPRGAAPASSPAGAPPAQPSAAPEGQAVWERPPTPDELRRDPRMASQERLVRMFARENGLNLGDVNDRRAAAGAIDMMTPAQLGELTNRGAQRQTQQHAIIMRDVEPRMRRRDVVAELNGAMQSASPAMLTAALHGGDVMNRLAGAGELRAHIFDFVSRYMQEMSGAAVSDGEMERFKTALGTNSVAVDPRVFVSFIRRRIGDLDREIDSLTEQYPEGWDLYIQNHRGRR